MDKEKNRNITTKIVSVFIGIVLWTFVMGEVNPVQTREFPNLDVTLLNEASLQQAGLVLMEPRDAKVTVKLTGRLNDINTLTKNDIIVQADLYGYSAGTNKVPIEIKVPEGIDVESTNPSQLVFTFDSVVTTEKPVILNTIGGVLDGHSLGKGQVNPSTVLIKGPRSLINSVSQVIASVDVSSKNSDIRTDVPLKVVDDEGKEVSNIIKEPNTVSVFMPVLMNKSVEIKAVINGSPLVGYQFTGIELEPSNVLIKGYEEVLGNITSIETEPIDLNYLTVNKQVDVNLVLPEGVQLVDADSKITATIKIEEIIEKEFIYDIDEITLQNLKQGLAVEIPESEENITISVKGLKSTIDDLDKSSIKLYASLLGLDKGEHAVNIHITKPEDVEVLNISPDSVKIILSEEP